MRVGVINSPTIASEKDSNFLNYRWIYIARLRNISGYVRLRNISVCACYFRSIYSLLNQQVANNNCTEQFGVFDTLNFTFLKQVSKLFEYRQLVKFFVNSSEAFAELQFIISVT